jgi:membrane-bound lytic murein transglycosylase B
VLDGTRDVAAVASARGGWQRAGGAMQFLPSSWAQWASDGDGDGVRDRHDLDDAAYAAARYLCASGADLTTGSAWTSAVRSYNHSDAYVFAVHQVDEAYAERSG